MARPPESPTCGKSLREHIMHPAAVLSIPHPKPARNKVIVLVHGCRMHPRTPSLALIGPHPSAGEGPGTALVRRRRSIEWQEAVHTQSNPSKLDLVVRRHSLQYGHMISPAGEFDIA